MKEENLDREQREFLQTIHEFRRRINGADFLDKLASALCVGAGVGLLFQAAAFVIPFYYVNLCTAAAVLLAAASAFTVSVLKRCTVERAALAMDRFGFQERIVTALEHLGDRGELIELQRRDALERLRAGRSRIKISLLPSGKKLATAVVLLLLLPVLALIPSQMKERSREIHELAQQVQEKEKEIERVIDDLEEFEAQELSEEQLAALQEMMESLQSSLSEYQQAASAEALAAAQGKLDFKYADMAAQLAQMANSLQSDGAAPQATAQAMEELAQSLQEQSGMTDPAGGQLAVGNGAGKDGQNGGQGGNQGDGNGDGQGDGSGNSNGQGDGNGDGQGDGSGQGGNQGDGNGDGGGNGNSQGSGQGDGNGDGSGSGNGQGGGSGSGRGEGSSSAVHDYVSVPNNVADSGTLTGNADHEDSDYYKTQNGLNWEGEHVSHEAVIGSYRERAYEGIAAGRYPSGMEDVIKNYFSGF